MTNFESLIFYIVLFFITVYFISISEKVKNLYLKRLFLGMGLLIPIIIASIRWNVGTDFSVYVDLYNIYSKTSIIDMEVLFFIIVKLSSFIGNFQYMFMIYSILTIFFTYNALKYNKEKYSISLSFFLYLFLYYAMSLNIMRQALAVSIILYSYRYLVNKSLVKYMSCVLLAGLAHTTALVFIPIYFIIDKKQNNSMKYKLLHIIAIFSVIFIIFNINTIIHYISKINIYEEYAIYIEKVNSRNRTAILKIILAILFLILKEKLIEYNKDNSVYILFYLIGTAFEFLGYNSPFIKRIGLYFSISEIYLLSSLPKLLKNKKQNNITILGIMAYSILFFTISYYILGQGNIIPYQSIIISSK